MSNKKVVKTSGRAQHPAGCGQPYRFPGCDYKGTAICCERTAVPLFGCVQLLLRMNVTVTAMAAGTTVPRTAAPLSKVGVSKLFFMPAYFLNNDLINHPYV